MVNNEQLILLSVFAPILVVILGGIVRIIVHATRSETKLEEIGTALIKLSETTDKRLRWLEENTWKRR